MKKTIRLTEADLTRIVKRIINEDLHLLGDPDKPMKKSKKDDDDLSDEEFLNKYSEKGSGWDVPHNRRLNRTALGWDAPTNKKLNRLKSIRNKKRGGMNEALGLLDGDSDNSESGMKMPKNYKTRVLDTYEKFKRYTRGSKIGSSEHLFDAYMKSGESIEVIMNPENNKKIFVLNNSGRVYNELDQYMGNFKRDGYGKFMNYLES